MATAETRVRPNILITGSPGTGKTTMAVELAEKLGFDHIDIGKEVRENHLYSEFDSEYNSHVLDEDKLLDHIEGRMDQESGGVVTDYHGSDFFPKRWFDIVVVLRCANTLLYDRLKQRGYSDMKIKENVECEIFGSLLDEALESYDENTVHEMRSETVEEMESNIEKVLQMVAAWKK